MHCMDVPWRVVLNEVIEAGQGIWRHGRQQATSTSILNALAPELRATEVEADKAGKTA